MPQQKQGLERFPGMQSLEDAIADLHREPQARALWGPHPVAELAAQLRNQAGEMGRDGPLQCSYQHLSSGIVLQLDGVQSAVVKAIRPRKELGAMLGVQQSLGAQGFPAPRCLGPCFEWGDAVAWFSEVADRGEPTRWTPAIRDEMASVLARLIRAAGPADVPRLLPPRGLWPPPHSAIFDFDGTVQSARPIDAIARRARSFLDAADVPLVVSHIDWSRQNMGFREGRVVAVFDWDALRRLPECAAVAGAAAFHSHDWRLGDDDPDFEHYWLGVDDTFAFIKRYCDAADRVWTVEEEALLRHALLYRLAYQARCQHALDPDTMGPAHTRLLAFAGALG